MMNEVIELGSTVIITDSVGNQTRSFDYKEVFAEIKSIGQSEFYNAAQTGFKPLFKAILADYYDYDDEEVLRYNGKVYDIIKVYQKDLQIELTVQNRVGDNQ